MTPLDAAVTLSGGTTMPLLGLGVYQTAHGEETERAVAWALEAGYRHVDTAALYRNEESVGRALAQSVVPREEVFVTTKMLPRSGDPGEALRNSLERLGLEYVDLYLVHWPVDGVTDDVWPAFEGFVDAGLARAVGVSNYGCARLERVLREARIPPAVNQVEFHPWTDETELLALCRDAGVALEAYSPLAQARRIDDPVVAAVADEHDRTPAQVLVRWCVQQDIVAIPKSSRRERIVENADVFDWTLSDAAMKRLGGLAERSRGRTR